MTAEFHKANRQRLYAEMKDGSVAVFFSGSAPRQSAMRTIHSSQTVISCI